MISSDSREEKGGMFAALVMLNGRSNATQARKKSDVGVKRSLRRPIVNRSSPPQKADPTFWKTEKRIKIKLLRSVRKGEGGKTGN